MTRTIKRAIRAWIAGIAAFVAAGVGTASAQSLPVGHPTFRDARVDPAIGFEGNYVVTFANLPGRGEPIRACLTKGGGYRTGRGRYEWTRSPEAKWHLVARTPSGAAAFTRDVHPADHGGKLRVSATGVQFEFCGGSRDSAYHLVRVNVTGTPGGDLRGTWTGEDVKGAVQWRRVVGSPTRVDAKIIGHPSFTFRMLRHPDWKGIQRFSDGPIVDAARYGARPLHVDLGRYYDHSAVKNLFTPDSPATGRGNRSCIELRVFGEHLWGRHYVWADPRAGLEVSGYRSITEKDARGRDAVVGLSVRIVMWQNTRAGRHALYLDGRAIPFDLSIPGRTTRAEPTLAVMVWLYGEYRPRDRRLAYGDFFKIRATYPSAQRMAAVDARLSFPDGSRRITLTRTGSAVFESAPQRLARPPIAPFRSEAAPRALRGPVESHVEVVWSEYVDATGEAFPAVESPIDVRGAKAIELRLAGAVRSVPLERAPAGRRLRLAVESVIAKPGTKRATASFALMDAVYRREGLDAQQVREIERDLSSIEAALGGTTIPLSVAQRRDLARSGFARFDLTAPLTKPTFCSSDRPLIVTAIAPPSSPPRDLYTYAKALAEAQTRYKGHLQSIDKAKRAAKAAQRAGEPILASATRVMLAAEFVRVAVEAARRSHADIPSDASRVAALEARRTALTADLDRARAERTSTKLYVEFEGTGTSEAPKINHVEVAEALARAERAHDGHFEHMRREYAAGRSRYRSLDALRKAPELRKLRARVTWLREQSAALATRVSAADQRIRAASDAIDRVTADLSALRTKRREAEQQLARCLGRVRVELAALVREAGGQSPTVTDANDLADVLAYARRQSAGARSRAVAARSTSATAYDEWTRQRAALPAHTAHVLRIRANTASAVCAAYRKMNDASPYDEFMKTLGRYVQVLNYVPTLILAPTAKHWELATSGKLEDGYARKLTSLGASTVWDTAFYYGEVADDLRLAGAHLQAQSRAFHRFGTLPADRLGRIRLEGRSAMSRFKDGFDAYKTTGKVLSLSKGLTDAAVQFEKRDPRAAFTAMKNVMTAVDLAGKVADLKRLPGFSLPLRGSLITLHLSLLADAGIKTVEAANRIADSKIEEALRVSLPAPPSKRLYSKDDLVREQYYKTYVDSDDLMQRIATHHQARYIATQLARNPVK